MVAPSGFVFFAATCRSTTVQRDCCLTRHLCIRKRPPPKKKNFYAIRTLPIFWYYLSNFWLVRKMYAPWKFTGAESTQYRVKRCYIALWVPCVRRWLTMLFYDCGGGLASNKIRKWCEWWCGVLRGCDEWDVSRQWTKIAWRYLRQPPPNSGFWATGKDLKVCVPNACLKL